ncbi:MAG: cobalamin-dependent protein [Coriobacteriia bacterium]|nr:cobalamin-dependent protein [Coriobacteriia bacterium]
MADDAAARLYQAFVNQDPAAAISVIEKVKQSGVAQAQLFDHLFAPAMSLLGGAWASGAIDEYGFTQAAVIAEQITSFVTPPTTAQDTGITILLGTMHRDLHAIDKDVTGAALKEAGHRVIDLGEDVRPAEFLERAEETGARIVIVFAQMNGTALSISRVREMFTAGGRDDLVLFVSGGPFAADVSLAKHVGANGVVRGAESALKLVAKVTSVPATGGGR